MKKNSRHASLSAVIEKLQVRVPIGHGEVDFYVRFRISDYFRVKTTLLGHLQVEINWGDRPFITKHETSKYVLLQRKLEKKSLLGAIAISNKGGMQQWRIGKQGNVTKALKIHRST